MAMPSENRGEGGRPLLEAPTPGPTTPPPFTNRGEAREGKPPPWNAAPNRGDVWEALAAAPMWNEVAMA